MVNNITLAATERESDQESNKIYNKKVNMFAFYQPLTVVNGIIVVNSIMVIIFIQPVKS